ncbi:MAG: 30S ribosomal protein S16 [Alphaproteobacteria bacterium]|nr:30S ribosomal protein S16 [Alphaproteobacteria bacterium]
MSVRIRLARGGSKKRPVHKIVVADKRAPRDGRFIESLGFYNPLLPKDHQDALRINAEAAKKWMSQGAELTERVQKLFALVGLAEKPAIRETPKKSAPKAKAQERMREAAERAQALKEAEEAAAAEAAAAQAETPAE